MYKIVRNNEVIKTFNNLLKARAFIQNSNAAIVYGKKAKAKYLKEKVSWGAF